MHSCNTLFANLIPYAERLRLEPQDVVGMATSMAHRTGFMYGLLMPIRLRDKRGNLCRLGEIGEIHVRAHSNFSGYGLGQDSEVRPAPDTVRRRRLGLMQRRTALQVDAGCR